MKATELRTKDVAALEKEVTDLLKAHFGLRMQKATQQLSNTGTLRVTRRDIARAKTICAGCPVLAEWFHGIGRALVNPFLRRVRVVCFNPGLGMRAALGVCQLSGEPRRRIPPQFPMTVSTSGVALSFPTAWLSA